MSLVDSGIAALQNAMSTIDTTAQDWSANWDAAKNDLINKAGEFSQVYNDLQNRASIALSDPSLSDEYQSLMSKGDYIKSAVQSITSTFDTASDWFNNTLATLKNAVGLGAVPIALNYHQIARRHGMGIIQIVSVAVIAAAAAAIVYWLQDAYIMKQKLDLAAKVQAAGGNPLDVLNAGTIGQALGNVKGIVFIAAAGTVVYLFWPTIKKALKL